MLVSEKSQIFEKEFGLKLEKDKNINDAKTKVEFGARTRLESENNLLKSELNDESSSSPSLKVHEEHHSKSTNHENENSSSKQAPFNDTRKQLKKVKKEFFEWSLLTKFDCFSKIFEYKHVALRILWTLIFLAYTGVTFWLVVTNIKGYYQHEVTTRTEIKNEVPTEFPTVKYVKNNF